MYTAVEQKKRVEPRGILVFCCEQFCLSTRTRMMSAPQGGTPAAVVNQPPAAPPTPSPDGTIGESTIFKEKSELHLDLLSIPRLWGEKCQNV